MADEMTGCIMCAVETSENMANAAASALVCCLVHGVVPVCEKLCYDHYQLCAEGLQRVAPELVREADTDETKELKRGMGIDMSDEVKNEGEWTPPEDKPLEGVKVEPLLDPEWEVLTVSPSHVYLARVVEEKDGWLLCKPLYDYVSQLTQIPPQAPSKEPMLKRVRMAFVHEFLPSTEDMTIPVKPVYRLKIAELSRDDQKNFLDLLTQVGKQVEELRSGPPRLQVVPGNSKLPPISEILKGRKP